MVHLQDGNAPDDGGERTSIDKFKREWDSLKVSKGHVEGHPYVRNLWEENVVSCDKLRLRLCTKACMSGHRQLPGTVRIADMDAPEQHYGTKRAPCRNRIVFPFRHYVIGHPISICQHLGVFAEAKPEPWPLGWPRHKYRKPLSSLVGYRQRLLETFRMFTCSPPELGIWRRVQYIIQRFCWVSYATHGHGPVSRCFTVTVTAGSLPDGVRVSS